MNECPPFSFSSSRVQNEAVTCKLEVKPIVAMAKWDKKLRVRIKHLSGS